MSEELVFSVDGFVVFPRSVIEVLREGEVIHVSHRPKDTSKDSPSSPKDENTFDSSSTSGSSTTSQSGGGQQKNARKRGSKSSSSSETEDDSETSSSEDSDSIPAANSPAKETRDAAPVCGLNQCLVEKKENALPTEPLKNWKSVNEALAVGDVVMYKLIELCASWSPQVHLAIVLYFSCVYEEWM